jgi:polyketide synthase 12
VSDTAPDDPVEAAHWAIARLGADTLRNSGLLARLLELTKPDASAAVETPVEDLTAEEIDAALDAVLGMG